MKKIVIHGTTITNETKQYLFQILNKLKKETIQISVTDKFHKKNQKILDNQFEIISQISSDYDAVFSLGGDGTFLDTLLYVEKSNVPILGFNMGRLGFLATIYKDEIETSLNLFFENKFEIENRTLLSLETKDNIFEGKQYALNECAIIRKDTSSMIKVKCYVNGQFLNTYWADGLMVATPTGSTAYSLSCGGPLMMPDAKDFVITPISPHNLNVRPLIVSDDSEVKFQIESRDRRCLISLDSRSATIPHNIDIKIKKADFQVRIIRIDGTSFPNTIRSKLGWGFDHRN